MKVSRASLGFHVRETTTLGDANAVCYIAIQTLNSQWLVPSFYNPIATLQLHLYLEDRGDQAEMRGEADG
jgi:hypothetical protein